ncbi:MAG: FHA domain-containing protein [Defluviitaleaceae bacterium]|nr:FHA domain-containing protein [Defluviitaleaceae bacterium]
MDSLLVLMIFIVVITVALQIYLIVRFATREKRKSGNIKAMLPRVYADSPKTPSIKATKYTESTEDAEETDKSILPQAAAPGVQYFIDFLGNKEEIITQNSHSVSAYGKKIFFPLTKPETSFGRDGTCDIVIQNPYVSRTHFTISILDNLPILTDKSVNGTMVNGMPAKTIELRSGDVISAAKTSFGFYAFRKDNDTR